MRGNTFALSNMKEEGDNMKKNKKEYVRVFELNPSNIFKGEWVLSLNCKKEKGVFVTVLSIKELEQIGTIINVILDTEKEKI